MNEQDTQDENITDEQQGAAEPVVETAPAVDETASSEGAGEDLPAVADPEAHPTIAEAEAMFAENSGLSSVLTDKGLLTREGVIIQAPKAVGV
jgi:hypothetical protein